MKRTVYPARMAVNPRAWARKLLPTPAGPTSRTCSCLVRNSMEKTASSKPAVQGDGGGPVEVLHAAGLLEAGALKPQFHAAVGAAIDLV